MFLKDVHLSKRARQEREIAIFQCGNGFCGYKLTHLIRKGEKGGGTENNSFQCGNAAPERPERQPTARSKTEPEAKKGHTSRIFGRSVRCGTNMRTVGEQEKCEMRSKIALKNGFSLSPIHPFWGASDGHASGEEITCFIILIV